MAENTFRSPGYFDREIDLTTITPGTILGTPAAAIGTANKGPAFVPVAVSNFDEFSSVFGGLDPNHFGVYAANEFLKNRSSFLYMRVLNAGANTTSGDILTGQTTGRDKNAGFHLDGNVTDVGSRHNGAVQFLTAQHTLQSNEVFTPLFTDNDSFSGGTVNLVRGMVMLASGARMMVLANDAASVGVFAGQGPNDNASIVSGTVKIAISSTLGNSFYNVDGNAGVRIFTASFDPTSQNYFGKILNTDPDKFVEAQHLLYADFPVDDEIATATVVAVLSGTANTSTTSGDTTLQFRKAFGAFDTRFKSPATTWFISQPFGHVEYDLFQFEALDDGAYANTLYKISITNIKASLDDANQYGTFSVQVRDWSDTDANPIILEQFSNCTLDPTSENYVAKIIGDRKVFFNFDATIDTERRLVATGKYPNSSKYVRVVMNDQVERQLVPATVLPFGFRGFHVLKTNTALADSDPGVARISGVLSGTAGLGLSGSIVPPIPFRVKVTRGEQTDSTWLGKPGPTEIASALYYWGVKFERNTLPANANITSEKNLLLDNYTKFLGIEQLDVLVTGSGADTFCDNKFTLAKVAFSNGAVADLTASINTHMREAAYVRNGVVDPTTYKINDATLGNRLTFAALLAQGTAAEFNRFTPFTKFTSFLAGGWDGTNILDRDARLMNDKGSSFDQDGGASTGYIAPGMLVNPAGTGVANSTVVSYLSALKVMTDPMIVNENLLAVPGIRESYITDFGMKAVKDYGLALFVMDIPAYDDDQNRLFIDSIAKPNVDQTANVVDARAIDNNYVAVYYPDVYIDDTQNKRRVKVPASIAAYGALGFNDRIAYPWFAPAGFNRAALDFVKNVAVRLNVSDRDRLSDSRINPIATFPKQGFVIYGQKTLQVNQSALNRVNVRRMVLEVKRVIAGIANDLVFEQNDPETRNKFVAAATLRLGIIQGQSGIEQFKVIMNETNNTQQDIDLNRLNGTVMVVPTRAFEFISMTFVVTNAGIQFT